MKINQITPSMITEAGIIDKAKALFSTDPALANLPYQQKLAALERDTQIQQLSKVALTNWQAKVVSLMRANQNAPISNEEYLDNLTDFIEQTLLKSQLQFLDTNSTQLIANSMNTVVNARNDKKQLPKAFNQLLVAVTAARRKPMSVQAPQAPQAPQGTPSAMSQQQATQAIQQLVTSLIGTNQQNSIKSGLSQIAGPLNVRSTGNPTADALLKQFGINIQ
jgi:hypothetical protein